MSLAGAGAVLVAHVVAEASEILSQDQNGPFTGMEKGQQQYIGGPKGIIVVLVGMMLWKDTSKKKGLAEQLRYSSVMEDVKWALKMMVNKVENLNKMG